MKQEIHQFRTDEVREVFAEYGHWGNEEFPLLAARYSPGGFYPVSDFTLVIAKWLLTGREEAIREIWFLLTNRDDVAWHIYWQSMGVELISALQLDAGTAAEAKAIHLLGSRMALYETSKSAVVFEIGRLFATRLASITWRPSSPEVLRHLHKGAENQALVIEGDGEKERRKNAADEALRELQRTPSEAAQVVGQWLQLVPPMTRLVIEDYFSRANGKLRPELYYGDRKYGCCREANLYFLNWLDCFEPPDSQSEIPFEVTRRHLRDALSKAGVQTKSSAKREELIGIARGIHGVIEGMFSSHFPTLRVPKREWHQGLEEWSIRCEKLVPVALSILSSLSLQSLRSTSERGIPSNGKFAPWKKS